jgi:plasmid stability protein
MPTLYVENVPENLYSALRERAREHRKSIAAEVLSLLEENVVTPEELRSRRRFLRQVRNLRARSPRSRNQFPTTEQMQREDRSH